MCEFQAQTNSDVVFGLCLRTILLAWPHIYVVSPSRQRYYSGLPLQHMADKLGLESLSNLALLSDPRPICLGVCVCVCVCPRLCTGTSHRRRPKNLTTRLANQRRARCISGALAVRRGRPNATKALWRPRPTVGSLYAPTESVPRLPSAVCTLPSSARQIGSPLRAAPCRGYHRATRRVMRVCAMRNWPSSHCVQCRVPATPAKQSTGRQRGVESASLRLRRGPDAPVAMVRRPDLAQHVPELRTVGWHVRRAPSCFRLRDRFKGPATCWDLSWRLFLSAQLRPHAFKQPEDESGLRRRFPLKILERAVKLGRARPLQMRAPPGVRPTHPDSGEFFCSQMEKGLAFILPSLGTACALPQVPHHSCSPLEVWSCAGQLPEKQVSLANGGRTTLFEGSGDLVRKADINNI